ncbi:Fis family transcriptional regulator [Gordoniibacillus kamchatkensis]|uniref:Fis family transcriptional regulator n=1 Tax=Gordoniibacillus kamchatkensis TaxID=1590651 RepID=A0ABR5AFE4_9BACL|nr:response regulator [Paenibacillus sp. VKM B-2647]KIL39778.1 Fis family transcriptional regulator [Paenibacillus sp. VKM B-2647]
MNDSIVVVDDDPIIRMDIREMLEEAGYFVAGEARNGEEAVALVARLRPALVIMDVKMPVMDGIKASRIIRSMREDTSILLLTAYSQRELVMDARQAGVTAYLVKPVSEQNVIPAVEMALSQKEKFESLKQDLNRLKQSIEERKRVEKAKGIVMRALALDEEAAYRKMRSASMSSQLPLGKLAEMIVAGEPEQWPDTMKNG